MAKFLEYVPGESFLHRMNPCVKLVGAVLIAIACFVTSNLVFLLILLAAALVMAASCGLGRETAGLCKAVFAFSLILAVVILLTTPHGMPRSCRCPGDTSAPAACWRPSRLSCASWRRPSRCSSCSTSRR
ncbi:MAG: hypothetical protein ACLTDR_16280 [Adlercreutzia equolifaciens]